MNFNQNSTINMDQNSLQKNECAGLYQGARKRLNYEQKSKAQQINVNTITSKWLHL
ncbi:MAG: hypothetical protein OEX07_11540 [Gammaproteobacteria bacterium]|nr:hypothetical protein [Gammaproteobacteria bacterium]